MISTFGLSGCAAYLSNSVFAGAALFGAPYMQSVMSGQAAAAVVVSSVQVISSAISVWGSTPLPHIISDTDRYGKAEEESARIFFGVSALYMVATLLAYRWLTSLKVYKTTMGALENNVIARVASDEADERQALLSPALLSSAEGSQILRVLKANFIYNFAVGYVFAVTLVSPFPCELAASFCLPEFIGRFPCYHCHHQTDEPKYSSIIVQRCALSYVQLRRFFGTTPVLLPKTHNLVGSAHSRSRSPPDVVYPCVPFMQRGTSTPCYTVYQL